MVNAQIIRAEHIIKSHFDIVRQQRPQTNINQIKISNWTERKNNNSHLTSQQKQMKRETCAIKIFFLNLF